MKTLWAPWRMDYIRTPKTGECVFCLPHQGSEMQADDVTRRVLARSQYAFVIMNLFPYANGHCMVVPYRHIPDLCDLSAEESADMMALMQCLLVAQREVVSAEGINVGINLGAAAGAGIAAHLHMHAVPRWAGDTSFMTVLDDVRMISEHIETTYEALCPFFDSYRTKITV